MENENALVRTQAPEAETANTDGLIVVRQLPIIEERLREAKNRVEAMVAEAKSMVCTAETVQAVKAKRAELNKEFTDLEISRKAAKAQIMEPYNRLNAVYEECITKPFKEADATLRDMVNEYQGELKAETRAKMEKFFAELCQMEHIDFLTLDQVMKHGGITISMADTTKRNPTRLKDAIAAEVASIAVGMDQVRHMDDAAEVMVEFKKCLNAGQAAAIVQVRKREKQAEAEAEERRKAGKAAQEAAAAKVTAIAPATETTEEDTWPVFRFTVYNCTRTQLIKIREFLKAEGIQYGK